MLGPSSPIFHTADPGTRQRPDSRGLATMIQDQKPQLRSLVSLLCFADPSHIIIITISFVPVCYNRHIGSQSSGLSSFLEIPFISKSIIYFDNPTSWWSSHVSTSYPSTRTRVLDRPTMVRWARRIGNQPRSRGIERQSHAR
ncbi:hypothetical protein AG1IA_07050 [Rhizoctonia solani AG-1 IA]|uniref:Uncharacterized protein n=1 Tax=Thanatephorus cucumeris (strain AG1-IA) TaxID=983506 RepID=L8WQ67_THACA|nr:hypothetical protein AG1IA_07050 [Rhizoctonia solani AG-1 IA]